MARSIVGVCGLGVSFFGYPIENSLLYAETYPNSCLAMASIVDVFPVPGGP